MDAQCPYCFEWVELDLDPESEGEMVQDCEICCRPWLLHIKRRSNGELELNVERAQ